jgi:sigma-B regulation protein RsbU (phosphoserine phosphatase)
MPAALFMALTRTLVRAAALETKSPAEALKRVNDLLLPDTEQGMFVTAVYGELDFETGRFTYVNAGHNPPYLLRANTEVEKLSRTAVALGATENPNINQKEILLNVGETLLLYTDGLTEAFSPTNEMFGETRLLDVMKLLNANTSDETLLAIEKCLNAFIETVPLGDDLTMVAIRRV